MDPLIGQLMLFAGNFAPRGWALCDGQLLAISANTALFSILGTTYGGDGRTTFALPDLRGRAPVHAGTGPGLSAIQLGEKGGHESLTLTAANLPSHNHSLNVDNSAGEQRNPANNVLGLEAAAPRTRGYSDGAVNASMRADAIGNTGGGQPVSLRDPYLAMNWCIALQGVFPSRG